MGHSSVLPDGHMYTSVINSCAKERLLGKGEQVHGKVVKSGVFEEIPERNVVSWTTTIARCAQNGRCKEASALFCLMQEENIKFDQVTLVSILLACTKLGDLVSFTWRNILLTTSKWGFLGFSINRLTIPTTYDKSGRVKVRYIKFPIIWLYIVASSNSFPSMEHIRAFTSIGKSASPYMLKNALIHMSASCGEIEAPFGVFKTMKQRTRVSWTRIVKHGYGDEAPCVCQLMESSKDSSVRPEEIRFLGVLCAFNHSSYIEKGCHYFKSMNETFGIEPRIEHFRCMVDLLSHAGLLDEAHELVKSMPMKPNMQFRKWQDVVAVRRKMLDIKTRKPPGRSQIQIEESIYEFLAGDARFQGCFVYSVDDSVGMED
ncbi:hypothetical protein CDL12_00763 [Handroanthus impetiginosus]|uniref:Pentatricopeptide repeat-containing protein n=1 Tax=Handroanthus impetiginosus TaxID=429701 RepID=A0A2G9I9Q8_9LAMI|nr:hypothetical protein CDL12_00763 [Handroanthus impetiginosus]